jgi:hypothetical protein
VVADAEELQALLDTQGLISRHAEKALFSPLLLTDESWQPRFSLVPSIFSRPADSGLEAGVTVLPNEHDARMIQFRHVYEEEGKLRQQMLYPTPFFWPIMRTGFFKHGLFFEDGPELSPDGLISLALRQGPDSRLRFRLLADPNLTEVDRPDLIDDPGLAFVRVAGDLNGDGTDDLIATVKTVAASPFGSRVLEQILYVFPVTH